MDSEVLSSEQINKGFTQFLERYHLSDPRGAVIARDSLQQLLMKQVWIEASKLDPYLIVAALDNGLGLSVEVREVVERWTEAFELYVQEWHRARGMRVMSDDTRAMAQVELSYSSISFNKER